MKNAALQSSDEIQAFIWCNISLSSFFAFWQYWYLNSGPATCLVGALQLEPHP
jgi:hypothetical protein